MAVPPEASELTNVFGLNKPQHMLTKLYIELQRLMESLSVWKKNEGFPEPLFNAFNTAVTAWHMTDWLWEVNATTRDRLKCIYNFEFNEWSTNGRNVGLERFQNAVAADFRQLHICREIAFGSKHMRRRRPDPDIKAVAEWHKAVQAAGEVKVGDFVMSLAIYDKDVKSDAVYMFIETAGYWEKLLTKENWITAGDRLPDRIIQAAKGVSAQRGQEPPKDAP